ncbi:hypothetical protein HDV06_004377 [Boothiomyces sp. JEL0866]|nr:hypothetical protein HDV06_004377 [Boothiomyces sp. JEL0866]
MLIPILCAAALVCAKQTPLQLNSLNVDTKIAVIGSGAAGSSLVYFLNKEGIYNYTEVYERSDVVGGRAKAINLNLKPCDNCNEYSVSIELGASIFASANQYLMQARQEFDLQTKSNRVKPPSAQQAKIGIWNGKWVYYDASTLSWWSSAKLLWTYGLSPIKVTKICKELVGRFLNIYKHLEQREYWINSAYEIERLDIKESLNVTCRDYLLAKGVSARFVDEFISSITRNIYLNDATNLHAFSCLVGFYTSLDDMFTIKEGNYKLYKHMLEGSTVKLETKVTQIEKLKDGFELTFEKGGVKSSKIYNQIVLATPLESSGIELKGFPPSIQRAQFPQLEFTKLYVTVVLGELNYNYFGLSKHSDIPQTILTPAGHAPFNCMGINHVVNETTAVVKFFSEKPIPESELNALFFKISNIWKQDWIYPGSYPVLRPQNHWNLPTKVQGLWYINSFEQWVSTMETETIAAKNIAIQISNEINS